MKLRDTLELLLLSAIWGASFLLISLAVHSFPPTWVALIRLLFGSAFLWMVLKVKRRTLPPRRLLGWLLLVAFFNNAIPFVFFAIGERTVPSNIAALLNATTPIWALLLSLGFLKQKSEGLLIPGVVLGFFGVMLVVYSHGADAVAAGSVHSYAIGVLFIALASAGYAVATVLAKAKLKGLDPIGLATAQLTLAGLMILPVALLGSASCPHRDLRADREHLSRDRRQWPGVPAVLQPAGSHLFDQGSFRHLSPAHMGTLLGMDRA